MENEKKAKKVADKVKDAAAEIMDINQDGKIDSEDFAIIQRAINESAKHTALKVKEAFEEAKKQHEYNKLQPIFFEEIDSSEFVMPKFICVCDMDKNILKNDLLKKAIGHEVGKGQNKFLAIYRNKISDFGIQLYPDADSQFYYMDPCDRSRYIELETYFPYLKAERIAELQKIAQDLGAKYFKITYKEKKSYFADVNFHASVNAKAKLSNGKVEGARKHQDKIYSNEHIEAENTFPGCEPTEPKIKYLHREPLIRNLIEMRLKKDSPLGKQKIIIEFKNTCGMLEQDAAKIDLSLQGIKAAGNMKLISEVQNEQRRIFEYEIEFPD